MILLFILLMFQSVISEYPLASIPDLSIPSNPHLSCFDEDTTCPSHEISSVFPNAEDEMNCQSHCKNDSDTCTDFTFYTSDASEALKNLCVLFQHPSRPTPCTGCISGPKSCVCGAQFACEISDDNVVDTIASIQNEVLCQEECVQSPACRFYTYFKPFFYPFPQTCFLLSSCDKADFSCEGCVSGPGDCRNVDILSTLGPTSPPTTTTTRPLTTPSTPTPPTCDIPPPLKHGDWFCPPSSAPTICHLECNPGYVSNNGTIITCHRGQWSSSPSCVAAVALVTGGDYFTLKSVELYGVGVHKKLPDLPDKRRDHSLDLVNSIVLMCGSGWYTDTSHSSCLTLTSSLSWSPHSSTTSPRSYHSSTSILGSLHLMGGADSLSTTEHLSPPSQEWRPSWELLVGDWGACAVKVEPEVFVMSGGRIYGRSVVSYNVSSGAATILRNLVTARYQHGCVYVRDRGAGMRGILVAGGWAGDEDFRSSEMYNIRTGEWSVTGRLTTERVGMRMIVLGDNVLAMGGDRFNGTNFSSVDTFNLTTMEWTAAENMLEWRSFHAVATVPSQDVGIHQN